MKLVCIVLLSVAALWAVPGAAQQVVPPLKKEFLDSNFVALPSAVGARYRRETEFKDSVGGMIRDYFLDGRLQSRCTYDHIRKNIIHGTFESWYENGQPKWIQQYQHGQQEGELRLHYANGQLKRHEVYAAGKRTAGECYDASGKSVPYFEYLILPVYEGGQPQLLLDIQRNTLYPKLARRRHLEGKVFITFVVDETGRVQNLKVTQGVDALLDEAALAAVRQLKLFVPGRQDGVPVPVSYTVPIIFNIR